MVSDHDHDITTCTEHDHSNDFVVKSPATAEQETQRRAMWKGAIQQELQTLVQEAASIRQNIASAKTDTKKKYFKKKFDKIQPKVMQMVAALQRLDFQEKAAQQEKEKANEQIPDASTQSSEPAPAE